MKRKIVSIIILLAMTLTSLTGCNVAVNDKTNNAANAQSDTDQESEQGEDSVSEANEQNESEAVKSESEFSDVIREQLEEIASINGISVEDLNVKIGADGYVTFLGNSYCKDKINDEDDALLSLESISDLIGLDGISLDFYKADTSSISGNTYYTFYQVSETEVNGKVKPVEFYNNMIKVAVDKNGNTSAVSTYLNHGEVDEIDSSDILDRDEVNEFVKSIVYDPERVLEDNTKLVYWDDSFTVSSISSGKKALCYVVYIKGDEAVEINNQDNAEDNQEDDNTVEVDLESGKIEEESNNCANYTAFVINALKQYLDEDKEEYTISPITQFVCSSIEEAESSKPTSMYFFDGKEDAGEYEYTLSTDWIKEAYSEYSGADTMTVKVPVVYEKATGMYYLADYNRHIVMANYYDCMNGNATAANEDINPIVSKTPEDIDSWGFLFESNEKDGIEKYFFDPNYVFGVYNNMTTIYDMFNIRYGLNGVSYEGLPILSMVYAIDSDKDYPEKVMDFMYNASCCGPINDWILILTSPRLAACVSPTVMGHEFTHGVNQQLTSSQYFNQPGAMMESYADIIGEELALLYGNDPIHEPWVLGGDYCDIMRNFGHPEECFNPKYLRGADYVPETVPEFDSKIDHGGVHTNSGVTNYLAYKLTHEDEVTLLDGEEILDIGTNVDMWFETLYLATYITDFNDVAHFITYTSGITGVNEGQQKLVRRLVKEHGLLGDCDEFEELLLSENHYDINYSFEPENEDFFERYEMCVVNRHEKEKNNPEKLSGAVIPADGKLTLTQSSKISVVPTISILDARTGDAVTSNMLFVTYSNGIDNQNIVCHIREVNLTSDKNDMFVVPEGETITQISSEAESSANTLFIDGKASFTKYGRYVIITQKEDATDSGEYNMYIVTVAD